ncbi:MAG: family 10 glycosylhydrolase, partial [Bacteroidota bacterium]
FALFAACNTDTKTTNKDFPKYWVWMSYNPELNYPGVFNRLKDAGIDGVILAASVEEYKKVLPQVKEFGLEVHAWKWILNRPSKAMTEKLAAWYMMNKKGTSMVQDTMNVPHYKFLCPIIPEVQDFILKEVEEILNIDGIDGLCMDYLRYPDIILPEQLQKRYGFKQDREYSFWDYGYHPEMIKAFVKAHGYNPQDKADPSTDLQWKQFRYDQITNLANLISKKAHAMNKKVSASPYASPALALKHVRQDFTKWDLDYVFPMVYSGFYKDDGPNWIADCVKSTIKGINQKDTKVIPSLFAPTHKESNLNLPDAMLVVEDAGADGIAIFSYNSMDDFTTAVVKEFITQ